MPTADPLKRGFVTKRASPEDGRGNIAKLTADGMAKLKAAWPLHLAGVRSQVLDHMSPSEVSRTARVLSTVAAHLDESS